MYVHVGHLAKLKRVSKLKCTQNHKKSSKADSVTKLLHIMIRQINEKSHINRHKYQAHRYIYISNISEFLAFFVE